MGHLPPSRDCWGAGSSLGPGKGISIRGFLRLGAAPLSICSQARVWVKVKDRLWGLNSKFRCRRGSVRVLCLPDATGWCQTPQTPRSTGDPRLWHQLEEEQEPQTCIYFQVEPDQAGGFFGNLVKKNREGIRLKGAVVYDSGRTLL